jgi:predicted nuclease with TOPRIM domain
VAVLQRRVDNQQVRLESNDKRIQALEGDKVKLMEEAVHLKSEATTLRGRVSHLESSLERALRRVRQLTLELIAHNVPVPPDEDEENEGKP